MSRIPPLVRWVLLVSFAVLNFLPIVNWIPGGRFAPWYGTLAADWVYGTMIAVGGGVVLAILSRRLTGLWREGLWQRLAAPAGGLPLPALLMIGLVSLAAYLVAVWGIEGGRPIHIDEIMQVFQARIFASGAMTRPAFVAPEFFDQMFLVNHQGQLSSQFPPGGPAMLALGSLVGMEWLVQPVAGAIAVVAFGLLIRRIETRPAVQLAAVLLMALAPFMVFMAGSHMNHAVTLMWLMVAVAALGRTVEGPDRQVAAAFVMGLGFGLAATIRPGDALAFALPAAGWLLWRCFTGASRWREVAAAAIGVALPVGALLWANSVFTGSATTFGYTVLWGADQGLGFHQSPWGPDHTPLRGLEQISLYFLKLQRYLYETPFPAALPAILALALTPRFKPLERYLLTSGGLLVIVYWSYFHNGDFLGPRFIHPLIPVFALWTARLPGIIRERFGPGAVERATVYSYLIGGAIALAVGIPLRASAHAANLVGTRWNADQAAIEAGATGAIVLVRESWGAQLLARLWALGVSRTQAELLYGSSDRCRLELAVERAEQAGLTGATAFEAMLPVVSDSVRLVRAPFSIDPTAKLLPNSTYTQVCLERIRDEQAGFTVTLPLLLADKADNIYARDLHRRDTLLLREYPDREVFLLKPPSTELGAEPVFTALSRDSLWRSWRGTAEAGGQNR